MKIRNINFLRNETGLAAIEMAFIMPFMLFLYFGLVDATGLISLNRKVTAAAGATADLVAQSRTTILKTTVDDYYNATAMIMDPTPAANVRVEVFGFRDVKGTITKIWQTSSGTGPSCSLTAPSTATMKPLMTAGNDVIVARSCISYSPYVASFMGKTIMGASTFLLNQTIAVRPRSSLQLTCYQTTVLAGTVCS
jgi:Flp pilus assembly protein TadG